MGLGAENGAKEINNALCENRFSQFSLFALATVDCEHVRPIHSCRDALLCSFGETAATTLIAAFEMLWKKVTQRIEGCVKGCEEMYGRRKDFYLLVCSSRVLKGGCH